MISLRLFLALFVLMLSSGCISRHSQTGSKAALFESSPTKLKQIQLSISGAPFQAFPGLESSLNGPPLQKRDTVVVVVDAIDTEVRPVTYSFYCPELDVKQESSRGKFEFAVTDTLIKKGYVEVEVRVNSTRQTLHGDGRKPFLIRFDVRKP